MHLVQSMAYVGEQPWHGLGTRLAPDQPLEIWAKQAGMDWQIESRRVQGCRGSVAQGAKKRPWGQRLGAV